MLIGGIQKNSFIDYNGKIAFVIFTLGCNMNCFYCHNRSLIDAKGSNLLYIEDNIIKELIKRKSFIDAVVITGGEPTLQKDIIPFIKRVRELNLAIKLDTNGSNPNIVNELIKNNLIDYIAMDIKAPFNKYKEITGTNIDIDNIKKSIEIILASDIDYEFRTTFVPQLQKEDIIEIAKYIKGAKLYSIQQYRLTPDMEDCKDFRIFDKPHNKEYINEAALECTAYVEKCIAKGIN